MTLLLLAAKAAALTASPAAPPSLWAAAVAFTAHVIDVINGLTHNYGWSMLLLAVIVRVALLPLTMKQFRSMQEMQAVAPYIKRLQQKYKDDRARLQQETMALYREHGVNPFAGCLPMLAQLPVLYAIFAAISQHGQQFKHAGWLWIGSALAKAYPNLIGGNLFEPDKLLLGLYAVSLYFSMKLTPTATMEPQQQQMMKTQALIMPLVLLYFGIKFKWMAAFVLYWFGFNVLSMAQQWYVMRKPSRIPAMQQDTPATLAGYPRNCPSCNKLLVVVKGSRCEACGVKVKKAAPTGDGLIPARASGSGARAKGKR